MQPLRRSRAAQRVLLSVLAVAAPLCSTGCAASVPHSGDGVHAVPAGGVSAGAGGSTTSSAPASAGATDVAPGPKGALIADALGTTVTVFRSPDGGPPLTVLPNPWLLNGASTQPIPQEFLVLARRADGWLEVQMPTRPNGSTGWLAPGSARVLRDAWRIVVSEGRHRVTVYDAGSPVYQGPVATGAPATPTPHGLFYVRVLLHTTDPSSVYGPYAYGLSAHSDALNSFDGGDAEIGIHGNNDPSVLGRSVTHGCVRMDNAEISKLAALLPLGTPVYIEQ